MLYVISKDNRDRYQHILTQMWKDRHALFVDQLGWALTTDGIHEKDTYDKDDTIYIVSINNEGELQGSFRLLPTNKPHLMSDHFENLCAEGILRGDTIWEVSRFYSTTPPKRNLLRNQCAGDLLTGMMEYALIMGVSHYTFVVSMAIFPLVLQAGWDIEPLGLPTIHDEELIIAYKVTVTPQGYQSLKAKKNIKGSLIQNLHEIAPMATSA